MKKLSHYRRGAAVAMVDVTAKPVTSRLARARGFVRITRTALAQVRRRKTPKGDPLEVARIAGNRCRQANRRMDTSLSSLGPHAH